MPKFFFKLASNNKGNSFITFALLTLFFFSFLYFCTLIIKKNIILQKEYIRSKDCLLFYIHEHQKYANRIEKLNKAILLTNIGNFIPTTAIQSKKIKKIIFLSQEYLYASYVKNLSLYPSCQKVAINRFSPSAPFLRRFFFKREKSGIIKKERFPYETILVFKNLRIYVEITWFLKKGALEFHWRAKDMESLVSSSG